MKRHPEFKNDKKAWCYHEMVTVLSRAPNRLEMEALSKLLERTPRAIEMLWVKYYDRSGIFEVANETKMPMIKEIGKQLGIIPQIAYIPLKKQKEMRK